MIVSDARRAANRRNALQSTGPRTDEGKAVARRNALKHGLTALVVATDDDELQERTDEFLLGLQPQTEWQAWLSDRIALVSIQLDRVGRIERQVRDGASWRALSFWDEDQRLEVEQVATRLGRQPARVVAELRRSPQGCDWLIDRWAMLANVADRQPWTPEQANLAEDLLGTPAEIRQDAPGLLIDAGGRPVFPPRAKAEVARGMIAELETLRARVVEADEVARSLAQADRDDFGNRDLKRLRRYERELHRRLQWLVEQFRAGAPAVPPSLDLSANPHARFVIPPPTAAKPPAPTKPPAPASSPQNEATEPPSPAATKPGRLPTRPDCPPVGLEWAGDLEFLGTKPIERGRSDPSKRRPDLHKMTARGRG